MDSQTTELAKRSIRNFDGAAMQRQERPPLYDSMCAGLSDGTAATKLGAGVDIVAPGRRSLPLPFPPGAGGDVRGA